MTPLDVEAAMKQLTRYAVCGDSKGLMVLWPSGEFVVYEAVKALLSSLLVSAPRDEKEETRVAPLTAGDDGQDPSPRESDSSSSSPLPAVTPDWQPIRRLVRLWKDLIATAPHDEKGQEHARILRLRVAELEALLPAVPPAQEPTK